MTLARSFFCSWKETWTSSG